MTLPSAAKRAGRRSLAAVVGSVWGGLLLAGSLSSAGWAQDAARATPTGPTAPGELQVFLMTFGPGREVWERFGHNAIWIHDPATARDEAYNYGLFDFHQHNFVLRFVRGQMWYWMAGFPTLGLHRASTSATTARSGCRSWSSRPAAKAQLQEFLRWNAEPEHRYYHYDYYRDNCSTRVRDAHRPGAERRPPAPDRVRPYGHHIPIPHPASRRQRSADLHRAPGSRSVREWIGPLARGRRCSSRSRCGTGCGTVSVPGPDGRAVPLVRSERTVFESSAEPPPDAPPFWVPWYLLAGAAIGAGALLLAGVRSHLGSGALRVSRPGRGAGRRLPVWQGWYSRACGVSRIT